jgi:hypothetical protein
MTVNAASGHGARAHLPGSTAYVNAKPEQQKSHGVAQVAKQSAFVAVAPATPAAGEGEKAGRTLDVKL